MAKKTQKPVKKSQPQHPQPPQNPQSPQLVIDYQGIYTSQKNLQAMCLAAQKANTLESYSKVKYKQNIYQVGQYLQLYDPTDSLPYICKLISILRLPQPQPQPQLQPQPQPQSKTKTQTSPQIPAILKVQWLLRKSDLPQKYDKYQPHFSIAQVFPSNQTNYVRIQSIVRKCFVLRNCQYQFLRNAGENIHFARAVFNMETGELEPHPKQWQKSCYCAMPVNPDLAYILCEKCQKWFHNQCVKDKQMLEEPVFYCLGCKKK